MFFVIAVLVEYWCGSRSSDMGYRQKFSIERRVISPKLNPGVTRNAAKRKSCVCEVQEVGAGFFGGVLPRSLVISVGHPGPQYFAFHDHDFTPRKINL